MKMKKMFSKGFTLLELMVVIIIVGILMALAMPAYRHYIVKSKLEEAKAKLDENYLWLDKMYNKNNGYLTDRNDANSFIRTSDLPIQTTGGSGYNFSIQATCSGGVNTSTATTFCLLATPTSAQAGSKGGGVECGTLMIDQSGKQSISTNKNSTENKGIRCF